MEREVTLDGFDGPDLVCPIINVWNDHAKRGKVITTAIHGSTATLLQRKGDACQVRIPRKGRKPKTGWITYYFIKELKGEWQEERCKIR